MIARIAGAPVLLDNHSVIVDVGGMGYRVSATSQTLESIGTSLNAPIALWTHLAVRENALDLYGFAERDECALFELLITVSGIGPKTALAIMSLAPAVTLRQAIRSGEIAYLTRVSGIGRKNAEKIVLELRDKLGSLDEENPLDSDALDALITLGYSASDAREALKKAPADRANTGERVTEALKILGSHMTVK